MAQTAVGRPFCELDLSHQRRLHPVWPLVRLRRVAKRAVGGRERFEEFHQPRQLPFVEARANVTDIDELIAVNAQQQRTEVGARLARLGPPADDELLLTEDLHFAPVW